MAYDEKLADRVRDMLVTEDGVSERKMFGRSLSYHVSPVRLTGWSTSRPLPGQAAPVSYGFPVKRVGTAH